LSEKKATPHLSVVSGNPSTEELAIVVSVIQAALAQAASAAGTQTPKRVASWHRNAGTLRGAISPGNGQWVASVRRGLH